MAKRQLPMIDDFHVHLRQGRIMDIVAPTISQGGCRLAYVMPNLNPPITTTDQALAYKAQLQALSPSTEFLMTLYLNPELSVEEIRKAATAGIKGVKSYPRGVTTNSEGGIESYTAYYHIFEAMQSVGMVLNLHGEVPSDPDSNICVLNAEEIFLKHLVELHSAFPTLKIVLEHATSKAAVDTVKSLGNSVGCTITVHHLLLTVDDWAGCCHNFCKPVAKFPKDREALRQVVRDGHPRFFLGTDSAPHPRTAKEGNIAAAGIFVTPFVASYLVSALDSFGALDKFEGFASTFGRKFYDIPSPLKNTGIYLCKKDYTIPSCIAYKAEDGNNAELVPFLASKTIAWTMEL